VFPLRDTIPSERFPVVTVFLILINVAIFLLEAAFPQDLLQVFFYYFGIVPARYSHPDWAIWVGLPFDNYWPFVTSMFLHGGFLHLLSNMWSLWLFGDNVEDRMGRAGFLCFYLLCGILAAVVHYLTNLDSTVPVVGASGAIAGVMGAYFVMYPRASIITLVPIFFFPLYFEIPAVTYLGLWFLGQLFSGTLSLAGPSDVGGIAFWAHVGGFLSGLFFHPFFVSRHLKHRRARSDL
jgi:membrane associated rhomboid family serine protease